MTCEICEYWQKPHVQHAKPRLWFKLCKHCKAMLGQHSSLHPHAGHGIDGGKDHCREFEEAVFDQVIL